MSDVISVDDTKNWEIFRKKLNAAFAASGFDPDTPYTWNALQTFNGGALIKGGTTAPGAGYVGEPQRAEVLLAAAVTLTTGTPADVISKSLTAGNWLISGSVAYDASAAGASMSGNGQWASTVSATSPTTPRNGITFTRYPAFVPASSIAFVATISPFRLPLSSPATLYLTAFANFTVNAVKAYGVLEALRLP